MWAVLGVDIGTQGTKAALFDQDGACVADAFEKSRLNHPSRGAVEEDPERQFRSVCRTVAHCMKASGIKASDVVGIGIAGQMAGVIGVGDDGKNVTPYDSWLDTRCESQIKKMDQCAGDTIVRRAGCAASYNHGPKKLWWKENKPKVFRQIAAFVQPGGYAAMRLCGLAGKDAFIDDTYLHFSGFADNRKRLWDDETCKMFKMPREKMPNIVSPHAVIGELTKSAARSAKLDAGTPVVAGCGDTAASFLAAGAVAEGICVDVAGTASVFGATTSRFRADSRHRMLGCGRSAVPGLWHPYAYINGGGMNLEWFRSQIAKRGQRNGSLTFASLDQSASRLKECDALPWFIPHLGGRVCPSQPGLRGAWVGLDWEHHQAHMYRSILESVALEYAIYRDVLMSIDSTFKMRELRVTGGGEASSLWNHIKADVLQCPVRKIKESSGAPMGAALVAGFGVGLFKSLAAAARRWVTLGDRVTPQRKSAKHYEARISTYRKLLVALDGF